MQLDCVFGTSETPCNAMHNLFFHLLTYLPEARLSCTGTALTSVSRDGTFLPKMCFYFISVGAPLWDEIVARQWEVMEVFSVAE